MTDPSADALVRASASALSQGDNQRALHLAMTGLTAHPDHAQLLVIAGVAYLHLGALDKAESLLGKACKVAPHNSDALYNLGFVLEQKGDMTGALDLYLQTLEQQPNHFAALFNSGNAFKDLRQFERAQEQYRRVLALAPHPQAYKNLGIIALESGHLTDAEHHFRAGLSLMEDADIRSYLGFSLLAQEQFSEGWEHYEARLEAKGAGAVPQIRGLQTWSFQAVNDLLILSEEGIGDVVMFASVLAELLSLCNRATLVVDERLHPLFARSFGSKLTLRNTANGISARDFDAQIALASCMRHFRRSKESFAATNEGYLCVDDVSTQTLRANLKHDSQGSLIVGVSWMSVNRETGADRSLKAIELAEALCPESCFLVNLQYGDVDNEIAEMFACGHPVYQAPMIDATNDLDGLASLIAACDIVVSIDNSTVHIAGAIGQNQIILLPFSPSWRWGLERATSLLYQSARLLRQDAPGDWSCLSKLQAMLR